MAKLNCRNQTVFIGDNREVMRGLNSGCIDLICADPPFNKEKRFDHVFGSPSQPKNKKPGFDDKWDGWLMTPQRAEELTLLEKCHPRIFRLCNAALDMHSAGMQGYLVMMATRLMECHRLLAETGSIYLHCDPSANAYLRLLMDGIFGKQNFRNEIIWHYKKWSNAGKMFQRNHDTILFYARDAKQMKFNKLFGELTRDQIRIRKTGYNAGSQGGQKILRVYDRAKAAAKIEKAKEEGRTVYYIDNPHKGSPIPTVWEMPLLGGGGQKSVLGGRRRSR